MFKNLFNKNSTACNKPEAFTYAESAIKSYYWTDKANGTTHFAEAERLYPGLEIVLNKRNEVTGMRYNGQFVSVSYICGKLTFNY